MLYSAVNGPAGVPADLIVIDENQALRLSGQFQRTWMRPPTRQELQRLADDFVKEEILYREAKALGLDQDRSGYSPPIAPEDGISIRGSHRA